MTETSNPIRGLIFGLAFALPIWALIVGGVFLMFFTPEQDSFEIPLNSSTSQVFNDDLTVRSPAVVVRNGSLTELIGEMAGAK
jgi:hypothetical protein